MVQKLIVSVCKIILRLPSRSLKEKRRLLKSLNDRVLNRFSVELSEVDCNDHSETAVIGFAVVANNGKIANRKIESILVFIEESRIMTQIVDINRETITGV